MVTAWLRTTAGMACAHCSCAAVVGGHCVSPPQSATPMKDKKLGGGGALGAGGDGGRGGHFFSIQLGGACGALSRAALSVVALTPGAAIFQM